MLRFTTVLILSLALHFLLYGGLIFVDNNAPKPKDTTEIELLDTTPQKKNKPNDFERPVVKNSDAPEPKEMKEPAKFMAEKNQRFDKQTKAKEFGLFKNSTPSFKSITQQKPMPSQKPKQQKSQFNDPDGTPEFAQAIQQELAQAQRLQNSTVPFDLPKDIEFGSATNLNADAHIYASFYNRVLELFYVRWAQRLDYIWDRLSLAEKKQLSGQVWATDVEILLDAKGLYKKGSIMRNSGYAPFDAAGIGAFADAKFFPNPPRAKVEEDGHVRLRYRIAVHVGSGL